MSPGAYIARRREAARRSRHEAAMLYAHSAANITAAELLIADIEGDRIIASDETLQRLRAAFSLDPNVYRDLVDGVPAGMICRCCACTWNDACVDRGGGPCSWAEPDLCSHCANRPHPFRIPSEGEVA